MLCTNIVKGECIAKSRIIKTKNKIRLFSFRICLFCLTPVFWCGKICLRYFKIGQTYFEICALYFFFAPNGA